MQGSTETQIRVCNAATPLGSRQFDHAGFLRCKTTVLRSCVLSYAPEELSVESMPAPLRNRSEVKLFVPEDELSKDGALDSLEGRPVSIDHIWQSTLGVQDVGNIAGKPTYDPTSKMVFADILVTDPDAIKRITTDTNNPQKLVEQSAAYLMTIDWTPGITEDGEEYDGIQRDIQYNHVALVGEGEGRAGKDVRILNKRSSKMADDLVRVKYGDSVISVLNSDAPALEKEMEKKESLIANLVNPEELKKAKEDLTESRASRDEAVAKNEKSEGEIEELRAKIDELDDPSRITNAANQLIKEREGTAQVYNSLKGKVAESEFNESFDKAKALQGAELHRHVVASVRAMNKKPELAEDKISNETFVKGCFDTLVEFSEVTEKTAVSGAEMTKVVNSKASGKATGKYATADARRALFHEMQTGQSK